MRERQIIYTADMILAKKAGIKTQTRRLIQEIPASACIDVENILEDSKYYVECGWCPYGVPGDRLYSKENYNIQGYDYDSIDATVCLSGSYLADGEVFAKVLSFEDSAKFMVWERKTGNIPSIYQWRVLSRFLDDITEIRAQRLQEITEADAKAEGVKAVRVGFWNDPRGAEHAKKTTGRDSYIEAYGELWQKLNAKRKGGMPWEKNPPVWAITTKPVS